MNFVDFDSNKSSWNALFIVELKALKTWLYCIRLPDASSAGAAPVDGGCVCLRHTSCPRTFVFADVRNTSSIFSSFEPHFTPWDLSTARPVLEPQIVALVCMLVAGNFDASSVAAWQKLFKNDFQTILEKKNWWKKFFCRTTVSLQTVLRRAVSPLKVSPHDSFTAVNLVAFRGSLSPADLI